MGRVGGTPGRQRVRPLTRRPHRGGELCPGGRDRRGPPRGLRVRVPGQGSRPSTPRHSLTEERPQRTATTRLLQLGQVGVTPALQRNESSGPLCAQGRGPSAEAAALLSRSPKHRLTLSVPAARRGLSPDLSGARALRALGPGFQPRDPPALRALGPEGARVGGGPAAAMCPSLPPRCLRWARADGRGCLRRALAEPRQLGEDPTEDFVKHNLTVGPPGFLGSRLAVTLHLVCGACSSGLGKSARRCGIVTFY